MSLKTTFTRLKNAYIQFAEKQGFAMIAVVCVGVITATAVWGRQEPPYVSPTPPPAQDISAALLQQQSLRDASTPAPTPAQTVQPWVPPLDSVRVLRAFNTGLMVQSGITGIWAIHDAVDLAAVRGEKVFAMADGVVIDSGEDRLNGVWLLIDHGNNTEALYAGLTLHASYLPGDKVFAGDVLGYAGTGPLEETDLAPHLHLRVTRDGQAIDPVTYWATGN